MRWGEDEEGTGGWDVMRRSCDGFVGVIGTMSKDVRRE